MSDVLTAFVSAIQSHAYPLAVALAIGFLAALAKQGRLSAWVAKKLPKQDIPYWTVALTFVGSAAAQFAAGVPIWTALAQGAAAAFVPSGMHEAIIERTLGGREIVPMTDAVAAMKPKAVSEHFVGTAAGYVANGGRAAKPSEVDTHPGGESSPDPFKLPPQPPRAA